MENRSFSKATLGRLPAYLDVLRRMDSEECVYVSSTTIAKQLSLGEVLVRKDLAAVSGAGKPRLGYKRVDLIKKLEDVLGFESLTSAVLVGAGKLGRALLQFSEFERYGVRIIAAFDSNEETLNIGSKLEILPMNKFDEFCKEHDIRIGIITVGEGSAQSVCDIMVKSGIAAIWNFATCKLEVPEDVILHNENLALSLAHLNNVLCKREASGNDSANK